MVGLRADPRPQKGFARAARVTGPALLLAKPDLERFFLDRSGMRHLAIGSIPGGRNVPMKWRG